jgi:hypothetical protein
MKKKVGYKADLNEKIEEVKNMVQSYNSIVFTVLT